MIISYGNDHDLYPFVCARFYGKTGSHFCRSCSKAKALGPARKPELLDGMRREWKVSVRRASAVLRARRSGYHCRHRRCQQADLTARINEIGETRVRYGYRLIHGLSRREGWQVNAKRIYRLYQEMAVDPAHEIAPGHSCRISDAVSLI